MYKEEQDTKTRDWDSIMLESDYILATELLKTAQEGRLAELCLALEKFQTYSILTCERELEDDLSQLMKLIILWKMSENYRTEIQMEDINNYISDIYLSIKMDGCLSEATIKKRWNAAFREAKYLASRVIIEAYDYPALTWDEVFNDIYRPENG